MSEKIPKGFFEPFTVETLEDKRRREWADRSPMTEHTVMDFVPFETVLHDFQPNGSYAPPRFYGGSFELDEGPIYVIEAGPSQADRDRYADYAAAWRNRYGFYGAPPSYDDWVTMGKPTGIVSAVPPELPALPPRTTTVTVSTPERGFYDRRPAVTVPSLPASGTATVSTDRPKQVTLVQRPIYGQPEQRRAAPSSGGRVIEMPIRPAFESVPAPVPATPAAPRAAAPAPTAVVDVVSKTVTEVQR